MLDWTPHKEKNLTSVTEIMHGDLIQIGKNGYLAKYSQSKPSYFVNASRSSVARCYQDAEYYSDSFVLMAHVL